MRDSRFDQKFHHDSPMADSPVERRHRAMADLGLSEIFINFQSSSNQRQTQGLNTLRCAERFER